jgi:Fe-S cluster assembly protein SufD
MNANAHWLDARRAEAANRFAALGVPHRRVEDWKYSDLKSAIGEVEKAGPARFDIDCIPAFVTSYNFEDGEAPDWVRQHLGVGNAMSAAALAFSETGWAFRVSGVAPEPMRLKFHTPGHTRVLVVLDDGAELALIETVEHSTGLHNVGVDLVLGAGARLTHIRIAEAAPDAVQVEQYAVRVARDGVYRAHLFNGGAKLSRAEFQIALAGENASAQLSGVSVLGDGAHADVTTHVVHAVGHTTSTQLFKHVAGGKSRAVYQGRVTVEQGADKSDSRQTAKALLMGERAEADLKPELEIFADDVKCAHGAAVGDLDTASLFYLRARGIPEAEARNMLVRAFLEEAVDEIADEALRETVWASVEAALPKAMLP